MVEIETGAASPESVSRDDVSEPNAAMDFKDVISGVVGKLEDLDSMKTPIPHMSKNAQKRLAKQKYLDERKKARREHEKEQRKAKVAQRKTDREKEAAEMTPEEREEKLKEIRESRKDRKFVSGTRKERLTEALEASHNVVLDLDFGPMMRPQEIKSLMQQVMYCYAANNRAEHPCRLTLTGCQGEVLEQLQKLSGFENWRIHRSTEPYLDVFADQKEKLVYLTADSSNLIENLESDKIYIIGGLVDRNRYKDVTFKKAQEQGIATGKLPIGQHVKLLSSQVLTVNQVMEIILRYLESRDWHKALLASIPQRKRVAGSENAESANVESTNVESAEEPRSIPSSPAGADDSGNPIRDEGVTTSPVEGAFSSVLPRGDVVPLPVDKDSENQKADREEVQEAKRVKES